MKVGDRVRLVALPPGLRDDDDLQTKSVFEACLGQTFVIHAYDPAVRLDGSPYPLYELHVGHVVGAQDFEHSIWVEPAYLELVA